MTEWRGLLGGAFVALGGAVVNGMQRWKVEAIAGRAAGLGRMFVLATFLLVCVLAGSARAASPLSWSAPALVDHESPSGSRYVVSCPSVSLCVAGDGAGNVVTSTDPAGGAGAWTARRVDGSNSIGGVSCPLASLCVAVDSAGDMLTSQRPASGASAWKVIDVDGGDSLTSVSCPSASLCVAVSLFGDVLTSTDSTGDAGAWTATRVDSRGTLTGVSCPSASLCVGVDVSDDVVTSTDPTGGPGAWTVTQRPTGYPGRQDHCPPKEVILKLEDVSGMYSEPQAQQSSRIGRIQPFHSSL